MKLLYFAYDYPPERSPQSLRAERLTAGLIAAGYDVTVITRAMHLHEIAEAYEPFGGRGAFRVVRLKAGPLNRLADLLLGLHQRRAKIINEDVSPGGMASLRSEELPSLGNSTPHQIRPNMQLNWKGRLIAGLRTLEERLRFPGRGYFWERHAANWLAETIEAGGIDGVILSHEPASALLLGRVCEHLRVPYIAELGDPVLALYTPKKWAEKALDLERSITRNARLVVTTSEATAQLLQERHGAMGAKIRAISQGFDPLPAADDQSMGESEEGYARLRFVYCGRFYPFRDPAPLFEAIVASGDGVELELATPEMPLWLDSIVASAGGSIIDRGFMSHAESLALQNRADILVNFANADPVQVPGKFYEYLGMCKPILHITPQPETDPQAALVVKLKRGWVLRPDSRQIAAEIARLLDLARLGNLYQGLDLSMPSVMAYSWGAIGHEFATAVGCALDKK